MCASDKPEFGPEFAAGVDLVARYGPFDPIDPDGPVDLVVLVDLVDLKRNADHYRKQ